MDSLGWGPFLFHLGLQALDALVLITVTLLWASKYYRINADSISAFEGFFHKNTEIITTNNISAIHLHQSVPGRIFNYGTIKIECKFSRQVITLHKISKPHFYRKALLNLMTIANSDRQNMPNFQNPGMQQEEIFQLNTRIRNEDLRESLVGN